MASDEEFDGMIGEAMGAMRRGPEPELPMRLDWPRSFVPTGNRLVDDILYRTHRLMREVDKNAREEQRNLDAAICHELTKGLDPCHDIANASDCERAIRLGLTPEEALRRLREGESFDE